MPYLSGKPERHLRAECRLWLPRQSPHSPDAREPLSSFLCALKNIGEGREVTSVEHSASEFQQRQAYDFFEITRITSHERASGKYGRRCNHTIGNFEPVLSAYERSKPRDARVDRNDRKRSDNFVDNRVLLSSQIRKSEKLISAIAECTPGRHVQKSPATKTQHWSHL
jgi:hypothetical protein